MSRSSETRWVCDGCKIDRVTELNGQPANWFGFIVYQTPEHAEGSRRYHLCPKCKVKALEVLGANENYYIKQGRFS